jgi:hypothetical protein
MVTVQFNDTPMQVHRGASSALSREELLVCSQDDLGSYWRTSVNSCAAMEQHGLR